MKDANELIDKYNGQIADGNKLSVTIVKQQQSQGLASRMGGSVQQQQLEKGRELIVPSSGYVLRIYLHPLTPATSIHHIILLLPPITSDLY